MVPWKYGFKSIKSIVHIRFTSRQPNNTWKLIAPREYGFYANVNPAFRIHAGVRPGSGVSPSTLLDQNWRHAAVQWLRRAGRLTLRRHGSGPPLLTGLWKSALFIALATPLALLAYDISGELIEPGSRLGADPGTEIVLTLGSWAIRILLLTLAVSTVRRTFGVPRVLALSEHDRLVCLHLRVPSLPGLPYLSGRIRLADDRGRPCGADLYHRGFSGFAGAGATRRDLHKRLAASTRTAVADAAPARIPHHGVWVCCTTSG